VSDPVDDALLPWWEAMETKFGPLELFDAHTHVGQNDPDGFHQTPGELLAALEPLQARAAFFAMHEPDGYPSANDAVLAAAEASGGRLVPYCRVDPRADAVNEAKRCLDAGAKGIKLHPRAEDFTLAEPSIPELVALAHERRMPVLIHAGRGIPALGEHSVQLAQQFPDARLILAHAAVSDLAWIWREMPSHPNLFIDTSWWNPGDMMALFTLVPSGQILWASDSPYGRPLCAAQEHLAFAIQAGVGPEALRGIAGGTMLKILDGSELPPTERPTGELETLSPHLERVVAHLVAAIGASVSMGDPAELVSLARLACDVRDDPHAELFIEILKLLDLSAELRAGEPPETRFGPSVRTLVAAMSVARTPAAPLP
jgi:predicted TIM-barrel fold metal-dependent hydrolase